MQKNRMTFSHFDAAAPLQLCKFAGRGAAWHSRMGASSTSSSKARQQHSNTQQTAARAAAASQQILLSAKLADGSLETCVTNGISLTTDAPA